MKTIQVFKNAKWIVICKLLQSIIQLVIGMISARYLGPSNYGLINYAASVVAFFMPIMKLGLDATLVHELLKEDANEAETLGTAISMNILSSIFCIGGVAAFSAIANPGEKETVLVCILYSTSIFFAALEMIQYWFQYKLLSKYSSLTVLGAYIVASAYKVYLLVSGKSIYWFALFNSIEYAIIGILLLFLYIKIGKGQFRFSVRRAKDLIKESKYYIFATLMVVVFQNTDHIMLTGIAGKAENGFYSAAITCAGVVQFVYIAIIDSFRPLILHSKNNDILAYETNISRLYGAITYLSIAQSVVFTIFARLIVHILYGSEYMAAVQVLQILTWYCAFSYMGTIRNIWLLAEGKQRFLPVINLFGVLVNIGLNAVMIPIWGAAGAAFASFITQFFTNFVFGFIFVPLRKNNRLLVKGLNPVFLVHEMRNMIKELRNNG